MPREEAAHMRPCGSSYAVHHSPAELDEEPLIKQTNFKVAQAEFEEHGYKLPKIVFWNLRGDADDTAVPVTHREEGTALVSGFSGHLLKLFMAGGDELDKFDPFTVMKAAISAEKYNGWKVVD